MWIMPKRGAMKKLRNILLGGALATLLVAGPMAPVEPAYSAGSYPCQAASSSSIGKVVSFSALPSKLVAGEDLVLDVSIDCPGDNQAVLAGLNLRFANEQNVESTLAPRKAELLSTSGTVKTYRVKAPTGEGLLPEGRQVLIHRSLVMEQVPQFSSGGRQPRYVSNSRLYAVDERNLPADVQMVLWHPTHAAPNPQIPWALLAGAKSEIRMPAWGAGAVLTYRWESVDGSVLSTQRDFVPAPGTEGPVRVFVTGTWPDGSVRERGSNFAEIRDDLGGFTDVRLRGAAVPYGGSVIASTTGSPNHPTGRWYRVNDFGSHPQRPIPTHWSATPDTLVPEPSDVGSRFQFILGGSRSKGASSIVTVTAAPPPGDRRTGFAHENVLVDNTAQLTQHLQPGYRLTAADPWPGGNTSYSWYRNGLLIPGATSKSYTLGVSDIGRTLQAAVATSLSGFSPSEVRTSSVKIPLANLKAATPTFTGAARVGSKLQASTPGWTSGTSFGYQWLRNGKVIAGATKSAYTLQPSDRDKVVTVRVTGKKASHTTLTRTAQPTPLVGYGKLVAAAPNISGTARVGSRLQASTPGWTSGTSFDYQWLRNGKVIAGATKSAYTLQPSDRGKVVTVRVTGKKASHIGITRTAQSTPLVGYGKLVAATPKISGTARVGKTLKAQTGSWSSGTKLNYQWLSNGKAIRGATKSSLHLRSADRAKRITVRLSGSKPGYTGASRTSNSVTVKR